MTMHLEGPWLSTTGKKKGPKKWASAEAKRKAEKLRADWEALLAKQRPNLNQKKEKTVAMTLPTTPKPYRRETKHYDSLPFTGGACVKAPDKIYTGTAMKGIGTMHKSNAVPVFSDEEAKDISSMRR